MRLQDRLLRRGERGLGRRPRGQGARLLGAGGDGRGVGRAGGRQLQRARLQLHQGEVAASDLGPHGEVPEVPLRALLPRGCASGAGRENRILKIWSQLES